ncbi:MAG: family 10 glycosylhydrolase [Chlorobi bacterium]|nr:family 10 glycosylhydrolase [Chlorobiota bacterium]
MMKKIFICFTFLLFLQHLTAQNVSPKREFRATWIATVANIDWPTSKFAAPEEQKAELSAMLDSLRQAGMNAIFFQVRTECDALYDSKIEPWSYWLTGEQGKAPDPYYDPLSFVIKETHKRGMELHAWFNPYRAVKDIGAYKQSEDHVSVLHKDWLIKSGNYEMLDPGLPEVREHIKSVMEDVLTRYDIDGIHFDDYFYPYTPITNEDSLTFVNYNRGFTNIDDWRRDNINLLMAEIYKIIKESKPKVKFGISPFGIVLNKYAGTNGFNSYNILYCDPLNWLDNKIVDYITPQIYWEIGHPKADYAKLLPWWATVTDGRHLYVGLYSSKMASPNYKGKRSELGDEIRLNRATKNVLGSVFFSAKSISRNWSGLADSMKLDWYKNLSIPPVMTWLDSISPLPVEKLRRIETDSGILLFWNLPDAAEDGEFPYYYLVYRFEDKGQIDLNDPSKIIAKVFNKNTNYFDLAELENGKTYYYIVTSVDRMHNESKPAILEDKN